MIISTLPPRLRTLTCILLMATLAIGLSACADETEDVDDLDLDETEQMEDDMDTMGTADVDVGGTISALEAGVYDMSIDAAVANIDGWIARMEGNPDLANITSNLEELRMELMAPQLDGPRVGELMMELGDQTMAAAEGSAMAEQLNELGDMLSQAGQQLTGGVM